VLASSEQIAEQLHRDSRPRRVEASGSGPRHETPLSDEHHRIVCRACGATRDVDRAVGATPCPEPGASTGGFAVDEAEVTFWGLCPSCQGEAEAAERERAEVG